MDLTLPHLDPHAAARALLRPRRFGSREQFASPCTHGREVVLLDGRAGGTLYGEGRPVLLVHGWEGSRTDLSAFVDPLVDRGFAALAVDLPAHGTSAGECTSIPQLAAAVTGIAAQTEPFAGAIAHSVGSAAVALAVAAGWHVPRLVLIAPPANFGRFAREFAAGLHFDAAQCDAMLAELERLIGRNPGDLDTPAALSACTIPGLILHSADDRVVGIEDGRAIAAAWPAARIVEYADLGHRRVLGFNGAVAEAVDFIAAAP